MLARRILSFATAALLLPVGAQASKLLSPAQQTTDAALLQRAYERVHPGLYRYQSRATLDAAFGRLMRFATSQHSSLEFYGEVSETIAQIRCDHSKAEYPPDIEQYRGAEPTFFPFRFRLFDGRMFVASSDPLAAGLERGSEILAIDGRPVREVLAKLASDVSYDGLTSFVVPSKLEADSDLMGSDFEQFYPVYYGFSSTHTATVLTPGSSAPSERTLRSKRSGSMRQAFMSGGRAQSMAICRRKPYTRELCLTRRSPGCARCRAHP